jgi:ubiquinone/menaquinone biosynthesis C-methylase UbiE
MFTNKDVAEYYDTTQTHYQKWWNLGKSFSLHYGIWDERVKSFSESLVNTNRVMMELSEISETDRILDAGCGVGGAALLLNNERKAEIVGISVSKKQIDTANKLAVERNITDKVSFQVMDYLNTSFNDEYFDVVWACESVCQSSDKRAFIRECYRILKKGGRLILCDYFLTNYKKDIHSWLEKWHKVWAISNLVSDDSFVSDLKNQGFTSVKTFDYTGEIRKSAKRLYCTSLIGSLPSELYNLFNRKVSRFAKSHYKGGYYQYKALKENLWKYNIILAVK